MPRHPVTGKIIESKLLERLDTHEIAWACGFVDGEGTFQANLVANNTRNPRVRFSVCQKTTPNLIRLRKAILNIGKIYNTRPMLYTLETSNFEEVQTVIGLLWKYLGREKQLQAKNALKKYHDNYKGYIYKGWLQEDRRERQKQLKLQMKINGNSTDPPVPDTEKSVNVESKEPC